jgi:hypothetical protein
MLTNNDAKIARGRLKCNAYFLSLIDGSKVDG